VEDKAPAIHGERPHAGVHCLPSCDNSVSGGPGENALDSYAFQKRKLTIVLPFHISDCAVNVCVSVPSSRGFYIRRLDAVSKHISSDNRFSARAGPFGGGCGSSMVWPLRGGIFVLYMTPLVGKGGGGGALAPSENCEEPVASLEVF
jgi:hypothetical protein